MKWFLLLSLLALLTSLVLANPLLDHNFWETATLQAVDTAIRQGADLDARDQRGGTPLHRAARDGWNSEIVLALLELGADHRARTAAGETAWDLIQENQALSGLLAA